MASSSLPDHLAIHNTSATEGSQTFAGINLGTIAYAPSETPLQLNDLLQKTLPVSVDASFSARKREREPKCLAGTRTDLLNDIYNWVDGGSQSIFWLCGLAGTGKSTIAQTVAATYSTQNTLGASFFFSRGGGDVGHAERFVTTVAFQLANIIPGLKRQVWDAVSERSDIATQSLRDQWQDLVLGPLSNIPIGKDCKSRYVLVIDALDECEDQSDIQIILQLLAEVRSLKVVRLRVLVTSRPDISVRYPLNQINRDEHQDFALHDIERSIVDHDITIFLRVNLGRIRQNNELQADWPEESAISALVRSSNGLFIWAATACRFIEQDGRLARDRLSLLLQEPNNTTEPARKLDEIYTTVLTNTVRGEYDEEETLRLRDLFRQVVGPIIVSPEPLSVSSLVGLLGKDAEGFRPTLSNLHSVLHVPEAESTTVQLLHPSFRDFLLSRKRCSNPQFFIDEKLVHHDMYKNCLRVMSRHLRRDICSLGRPGADKTSLSRGEVDAHIQPHVQYACRFWVHHYIRSDVDTEDHNKLESFFRIHFLHWLEALALLGCASDAVGMIHMLNSGFSGKREKLLRIPTRIRGKLKSMFAFSDAPTIDTNPEDPKNVAQPKLQALIHDAVRFILTFRPVMDVAPLQVYCAGLVFSPTASIIKKNFSNEFPAWLPRTPMVSENWTPCLQTLRRLTRFNHMAFYVACSPDGKTLASAWDSKTFKLWDAGSGKALLTLEHDSRYVHDATFSPDSKTLATIGDKTVRLWDTGSGKALLTLEHDSDKSHVATFSPDSKTLALTDNKTVKLWDISSGKALLTLKGYLNLISALTFSPDGKTIASASKGTVTVWDTRSGKALQTCNHAHWVRAITFSPDGKTMASAEDTEIVELWDISLGKTLRSLNGFYGVAFSPNSKTIALRSMDETIELRDVGSGKTLSTLKGHSEVVCAVAFSPDGQTLASASDDKTVKLWEAGSGKVLQTFKGHLRALKTVAFSPDGETLVSASNDNTVKVWDAGFREGLRTIKAHSGPVRAVAFSLDNKMVATAASDDKTIKLWDTTGSGKALQTLKGHSGLVRGVAFSPDNKMLASASDDKTVKLWDATGSGQAPRTLKGDWGMVRAVAFSSDGKTLASASVGTVALWGTGPWKALQQLRTDEILIEHVALAFSPDGKTLAWAMGRTVRLWDIVSKTVLREFEASYDLQSLSFLDTGFSLLTDREVLLLSDAPDENEVIHQPAPPQSMSVHEDWTYSNGERILWLPSEYRPQFVAIHGSIVVFGYSSGQVLIANFVF